MIAIKQRRGNLDDGTKVTEAYICGIAQERWGFKLNSPNLQTHGQKHFKAGDPQVLATRMEDAKLDLQERSRKGEITKVPVDDYLERIVGIASAKAEADPNSVTIDHGLKAAAELTKRRQDDAMERQMMMAGAGLARALGVAEKAIDRIPAADEMRDVVDAEVVPAGELAGGE